MKRSRMTGSLLLVLGWLCWGVPADAQIIDPIVLEMPGPDVDVQAWSWNLEPACLDGDAGAEDGLVCQDRSGHLHLVRTSDRQTVGLLRAYFERTRFPTLVLRRGTLALTLTNATLSGHDIELTVSGAGRVFTEERISIEFEHYSYAVQGVVYAPPSP